MINDNLPQGATPLSPDDLLGLIPPGITNRGELDQFERRNIGQALNWAIKRKRTPTQVLNLEFCRELHRRMFDRTWEWAGAFRQREVNIGNTPPMHIGAQLHNLCQDALTWIEFGTYSSVEIAVRVHHKSVYTHPFPNGNGRFTRILADCLNRSLKQPVFNWGEGQLLNPGAVRTQYLAALRSADQGDYQPLLAFVGH